MFKNKNYIVILTIVLGFIILSYFSGIIEFIAVSIVVFILSIVSSSITEKIVWGWNKLSQFLGFVNSKVLLIIIFYSLLVPLALLAKFFSRNDLFQLKKKQKGSYYKERDHTYTLDDLKNMPKYVAKLKEGWRKGDLNMLHKYGLEDMQTLYPSIYQSLIKTRNENWLVQIAELIKTPEIEALYVGALHLPGKDGLLARLLEMGYTVKRL